MTLTAPGTYRWVAIYSGDAKNNDTPFVCNAPGETSVITQGKSAITTKSTTTSSVGGTIQDTATTFFETGSATGTITFTVYGPDDALCTGAPIAGGMVSGPFTDLGTYSSNAVTVTAPGVYRWIARYSGDLKTQGATTLCNDPGESSLVPGTTPPTKFQPTVTTEIHKNPGHTATTSVPAGSTVHDKATVSGTAGTPTGTVTFTFYTNGSCAGNGAGAGTVTLNSGVADPSSSKGPLSAGSYSFKAHYNGSNTYVEKDGGCEPLTVTAKPPPCRPDQYDRGRGQVQDEHGGNGGDFDFDECDDNHNASHRDQDRNVDFQGSRHDPPKYESSSRTSFDPLGGVTTVLGIKATTIGEGVNNGLPVTYTLVVTDLGLGPGTDVYWLTLSDQSGVIYTRTGFLRSGDILAHP
jgi:hypothetical protein